MSAAARAGSRPRIAPTRASTSASEMRPSAPSVQTPSSRASTPHFSRQPVRGVISRTPPMSKKTAWTGMRRGSLPPRRPATADLRLGVAEEPVHPALDLGGGGAALEAQVAADEALVEGRHVTAAEVLERVTQSLDQIGDVVDQRPLVD